jgi:hypothetical protein
LLKHGRVGEPGSNGAVEGCLDSSSGRPCEREVQHGAGRGECAESINLNGVELADELGSMGRPAEGWSTLVPLDGELHRIVVRAVEAMEGRGCFEAHPASFAEAEQTDPQALAVGVWRFGDSVDPWRDGFEAAAVHLPTALLDRVARFGQVVDAQQSLLARCDVSEFGGCHVHSLGHGVRKGANRGLWSI